VPPSLRLSCPTTSPQLDRVFRKMVAKRPADRYATVGEVIAALESVGQPERPAWMAWAGGLAAVVVVLLAILIPKYWGAAQAPVEGPKVPLPELPPKPPALLPATFTREDVEKSRQGWAKALKVPASERNSIG